MHLSFVDHLVFAAPDLSEGIRHVETLLGVKAIAGGRHPGFGTRNALVGLGGETYLEIIGPDPEQPEPEQGRPFEIDHLAEPRLVTWAARVRGRNLDGMQRMSRTRPDGVELAWSLSDVYATRAGGVVPFLIDWGATEHPALSLPSGCQLLELVVEHPDAEDIQHRLKALDLSLPVQPGTVPRLMARIRTPQGVIELS